jgi:hypothetical protein
MRSNLWTIAAVAVIAYAACDMTHEVLGHGVACWLLGVRALGLSTVGLQTETSNRLVAAAGTFANLIVGHLVMLWVRRARGFGPLHYFGWLFAVINLLNGTGYLMFSGILDFGDWAVVIAPFTPHAAWRVGLIVVGVALYAGVVIAAARELASWVQRGELDRAGIPRLVFPAYVVGGLLFVAGSALNPVGPQLILLSGVSSGFAAMAGLTLVPSVAMSRTRVEAAVSPVAPRTLPFARHWVISGALVALAFIAILGRGIPLT